MGVVKRPPNLKLHACNRALTPKAAPTREIRRMEHANIEIAQLEAAVSEAADAQVQELNDLHLALVGGGTGSVVFA
jgi:hypothetical protein